MRLIKSSVRVHSVLSFFIYFAMFFKQGGTPIIITIVYASRKTLYIQMTFREKHSHHKETC
jgi:type III secretory pathway component EscT